MTDNLIFTKCSCECYSDDGLFTIYLYMKDKSTIETLDKLWYEYLCDESKVINIEGMLGRRKITIEACQQHDYGEDKYDGKYWEIRNFKKFSIE